MGKYDDIIHHEVPTSLNHPRMSSYNRAAQFAPFAALVGYAEAINESREKEDERRLVGADKKEEIEGLLHKIQRELADNCFIEVTYFTKTTSNQKGKYVTYRGKVKKIDTINRVIVFENKKSISIKDICDLVILDYEQ